MDSKSLFEILIRENTEMLLAFLRSSVRDGHAVDDLYQETFLAAWKRLSDYDRKRPFGPWLRGIAQNVVLAHYRNTARADTPLDCEAIQWLDRRFEAIQKKPGDTFQEKLTALHGCVEELPEPYREPVTLRYLEQHSVEQVSSSLRVTREALKKRFARAKSRLADCLERKLNVMEAGS